MPQTSTRTITEAMVQAAFTAPLVAPPTPYQYDMIGPAGALTAFPGTHWSNAGGWTITSAPNGTGFDLTKDITADPTEAPAPGVPWPMQPLVLKFTDTGGTGAQHTVRLPITCNFVLPPVPNSAPTAVDDGVIQAMSGVAVNIDVQDNDSDPENDTLTTTIVTPPPATEGTVSVNPDGTVTFMPAAGFTGTTTFTYQIDDGNGGTDTATVTVEVVPFFDIYARLGNAIGGGTITYRINTPENNVSLMRVSDGVIVATGGGGSNQTYNVPVGDDGEDYWIIDDTAITTAFQVDIDVAANAVREFHAVNENIRWLDALVIDALEETHFPAQNYPNMTLLESGGDNHRVLNINGTFPNTRLRINARMNDVPNTQIVRIPTTAEVSGVGGNMAQINIRSMDTRDAISNNLRAASGGGDVTGNTLIDLPAGNDFRENVSFIDSTTTGAMLPVAAFATVASQFGNNQINFSGPKAVISDMPPAGTVTGAHDYTDETDPYHVSYWIEQLVAAGRDSSPPNYGLMTDIGIWCGSPGNYLTLPGFPTTTYAAADLLAGTPQGTAPTKWFDTTGSGEFRE